MKEAHDDFGHRGTHAVFETLRSRFYWPYLYQDVRRYVSSCHQCQIRQVRRTMVSPTPSMPSTIFTKIYVDVMDMPKRQNTQSGYKYIVAARDDLSQAAEGRALTSNTAAAIAKFLWEDIICRYGHIHTIITDNGKEMQGACQILLKKYGIPHIFTSPYNSRANGVVERGHFVIREAIMKACAGKIYDWPRYVPHAFFADKIMPRKATGYSPFYLLHGVDPVLPFDLTEATFMMEGFKSNMAREDLLALRIRQLEKRPEDLKRAADKIIKMRFAAKAQFEKRFSHRLRREVYEPGELVLVYNSIKEKSHDQKGWPRYNGPYEVVRRTKGGSYLLKELDGVFQKRGIAAARLMPYIPRTDAMMQALQGSPSSDNEDNEDEEDEEYLEENNEELLQEDEDEDEI
jgi:hypothetical protein